MRKILHESQTEKEKFSGHRTPRCREVFAIAERLCREMDEEGINFKHLLAAVLSQQSSALDYLFSDISLDRDHLLKDMANVVAADEGSEKTMIKMRKGEKKEEEKESSQPSKKKTCFLDKYGRDLTQLARAGKLDQTIGRKEEIKKVAQILTQKKKNNPILVGDAGVGKTCIVEGLALKTVEPQAPTQIRDFRIVELSMGSLVAGTKYRGEFEERLDNLIKEASSDPNIVLFIDEIHTMVGAGASVGYGNPGKRNGQDKTKTE